MYEDRRQVEIRLSARQTAAFEAMENPEVRAVMYGGAKGGGKSVFACIYNYHYAGMIIAEFGLQPSENPVPIAFMGRKRAVDFKKTTLETWKRIIPGGCYRINKADQEIIIAETVKILYGGLDDTQTINKFNSAEFGMITVDQAEECTEDDVSVLRASLRLKVNNRELPYKELYTANPAQCWLKGEFIDQELKDHRFIQALPSDNPYLAAGYVETLKNSFKHRPELLEAYLHGSWTAFTGADQIIREEWIRAAKGRKFYCDKLKKFLVCDVARFGDDETVIMLFSNTNPVKVKTFGKRDTMFTANVLHIAAIQENCSAVVVDACGVGGGVVDRLREMADGSYEVIAIDSAGQAKDKDTYQNVRAEMWDTAAQKLQIGEVELTYDDMQLFNQLCSPRYFFRNGKIAVEKKEDIKKRLGRSPDRADCYVMGLYAVDDIAAIERAERKFNKLSWLERHRRAAASAMSA